MQMKLHHLKFKWMRRYSPQEKVLRLARIMWQRGRVGDGKGYSAKFTISLCRRLLSFEPNRGSGWYLIAFGLRIHFQKSWGGIHC